MSKEIEINGQLSAIRSRIYGGLLSKRNPVNNGVIAFRPDSFNLRFIEGISCINEKQH
jgi:hypothetical protein